MLRVALSGKVGDTDRIHFQVLVDAHGNGHRELIHYRRWTL
jgi:hypothetical protein